MRQLLLLLILLPVCLSAQKKDVGIFGKGWYLSLTFQGQIDSEFSLTPFVTAADTLARNTNPFRTTPARQADTININGSEILYYWEPGLRRTVSREKAIFNLLSSIRLHHRTGDRLEFSAGLFYQPTFTTEDRTDDLASFPNDFYYSSSVREEIYGGLVTDFNYHLRKDKRLRPYLGLQVRLGISYSEFLGSRQVFPRLGQESELTNTLVERFRTNTIFDFDMDLLSGINYQLGDRLAIGIEARLSRYLIPIPRALQLRYRLGKNREVRR